jgi:hypothetical protein
MCSTVFQLNWERVCNAAKTQDLEFRFLVRLPHASAIFFGINCLALSICSNWNICSD